jgi:thiaminase
MNLNKDQFKSYLIRDKGFLKELYEGSNHLAKKHKLQTSEDSELNTLIKYLHFVANGEIKIKSSNFQILQESKLLNVITKHVEKKSKTFALLRATRITKLHFLLKLTKVFGPLLYALFNEE